MAVPSAKAYPDDRIPLTADEEEFKSGPGGGRGFLLGSR